MASELALLSLTQLQNLAHSDQHQQMNPNSTESGSPWMWNPNKQAVQEENDEDSWEVRAFAEDTGNIMGTTWPPRSYTCTFCRREFRSAQALGGHMNVHRRDRARLHQNHTSTSSSNSSSTLIIPTQEVVANGGLCFLYQLPNPNGSYSYTPKMMNPPIDSPSTLLSISPYLPNMVAPPCPPPDINYSLAQTSSKSEATSIYGDNKRCKKDSAIEEVDLELRLGH